ncbi:hypothetical protein GOV09_05915 [Candidatus Woesearchaeota archaeon]|nr:hypothetical protein [Candidatus Woesearchaeota archaeon]
MGFSLPHAPRFSQFLADRMSGILTERIIDSGNHGSKREVLQGGRVIGTFSLWRSYVAGAGPDLVYVGELPGRDGRVRLESTETIESGILPAANVSEHLQTEGELKATRRYRADSNGSDIIFP